MRRFTRPVVLIPACYVALVAVGTIVIAWRATPTSHAVTQRETMSTLETEWPIRPNNAEVPAKPAGLWTLVHEYVRGPALIRFSTDPAKKWNYASRSACTADGDLTSMIAAQMCVLPGVPVGALIAKVGGSSAGQADGKVFLVGSFAIIEIDANTRGALYLTINDEVSGMDNNSGSLTVTIAIKPLTSQSAPTTPAAPATPSTPQ